MKTTHIDELMHAVLDGEASEPQARELERALAADPAAKARFEELKRLFMALEGVPEATPPADIVERILARTRVPPPPHSGPDQLFGISRVREAFGQLLTGGTMSQPQNGNARRRNIWIGIGLAAVGAVLFGHYVLEIPQGADNLSGTVVPAQRYRSDQQVKPSDVRLGDQTVTQLLQNEDVDRLIKDPGFQALAADQAAMTAFATHAQAYAVMAQFPAAMQVMAQYPAAFHALSQHQAAFNGMAANQNAFQVLASNSKALNALNSFSAKASALNSMSLMSAKASSFAAAAKASAASSSASAAAVSASSAATAATAATAKK